MSPSCSTRRVRVPRAAQALWGLSLVLALAAATRGGSMWWLMWPALNIARLAFSYSQERPRPFGKRRDGTLAGERVFLYLPLLLMTWGVWHLWRLVTRTRAFDQVDETLIVGRRLLASEPPPGAHHYLDLTQEFTEPKAIRERAGYWSFPILDAAAPPPEALVDMVLQLPPDRILYIHCAQGHGRTGLVACVVLLATGRAATAAESLERIRHVRPGVWLSRAQDECLQECERLLKLPIDPDATTLRSHRFQNESLSEASLSPALRPERPSVPPARPIGPGSSEENGGEA